EDDRGDASRLHAADHDGRPDLAASHVAHARMDGALARADLRAAEPERHPGHRDRRDDHDEPDHEIILSLHRPPPGAGAARGPTSSRVGRASMNCRTTGSVECWISCTVPTCRTLPSYRSAMREATRYALRMSCVMTTPVTPSCFCMRIISSSITALV